MTAKKKTTKKKTTKKNDGKNAIQEAILAESKRLKEEREKFEKTYKPFSRNKLTPENAVKECHEIAEHLQCDELSASQVKLVCDFIRVGRLMLKNGQVLYKFKKGLKNHDGELQNKFEIKEVSDKKLEDSGVDAFKIGYLQAQGRGNDVERDQLRKLAGCCLAGLPDSNINDASTADIMAVSSLYMVFFLGQ